MRRIIENILVSSLNIKRLNDISQVNTLVIDQFALNLISISLSYLTKLAHSYFLFIVIFWEVVKVYKTLEKKQKTNIFYCQSWD